ncbi:sigma-70 family RNA polymerase sigma factor [Embleya sp. NBC_00888]|uniref:sigma-70 family RNA polymerase sigma factor n=1 Tax=Embleya sp. NBC_00888 TaxID=2975960 RepID=UPI00386D5566|nr:sigma-70 family RNA polymerase sigma factor [Embleya sp. NBC_00888]
MTTTVHGDEEFVRLTRPFERELLAYCYRMLGSVHDAEDLVQEIYLRAWRGYAGFEGRAALRTWLYRIATNVCLRALERRRGRRDLPAGLGGPTEDPTAPLAAALPEPAWLQPIPDALFVAETRAAAGAADPAAIVTAREGMRLALTAAFQYLPPRQRAVLILRDVLGTRAAEAADLLGISTAAVNSVLQRARARLAEVAPVASEVRGPGEPAQRALLDRYAAAFENADMVALMGVLTEDAVWEMPPTPSWFVGPEAIVALIAARCPALLRGGRMIRTAANGQPAFALYAPDPDGVMRPHAIQVLTLTDAGVTRVVSFMDRALFPTFGLPDRPPGR